MLFSFLKNLFELEWFVSISRTLKEFILELNPMETESMEGGLEQIHAHEDTERAAEENVVRNEHHNEITALKSSGHSHGLVEEHLSQLTMSKRQSPQSQVTCSVGNCTQGVLDCLNHGVDESITESFFSFDLVQAKNLSEHTSTSINVMIRVTDLVIFSSGSVVARLDKKHQWYAKECNDDADLHD